VKAGRLVRRLAKGIARELVAALAEELWGPPKPPPPPPPPEPVPQPSVGREIRGFARGDRVACVTNGVVRPDAPLGTVESVFLPEGAAPYARVRWDTGARRNMDYAQIAHVQAAERGLGRAE